MTAPTALDVAVTRRWTESWDQQQTAYLPHRLEQFDVVAHLVATAAGPGPRVLDLGCGPGTLGRVVHRHLPKARVTGVDHDPLLLALAGGYEREGWLAVVDADLRDPAWVERVGGSFDAVVAATALHWLSAPELQRTYRDVRGVLRPGGIFVNSDTMPETPEPTAKLADIGDDDPWARWWSEAEDDPALAHLLAVRAARRSAASAEFMPPPSWHAAALVEAGFSSVRVAWRRGPEAVLSALAA